jgi:hypothetical protein
MPIPQSRMRHDCKTHSTNSEDSSTMIPSGRKLYYSLLLVVQASLGTFGHTFICNIHKIQKNHIPCAKSCSALKFFIYVLFLHLICGQTNKTFSNLVLFIQCILTIITHIHPITHTNIHTHTFTYMLTKIW